MNTDSNEEELKNNSPKNVHHQSDAAKLTAQHMSDPDHIITDEDMRSMKVGEVSQTDAPTEQAIKDANDKIADRKMDKEDDTIPGAQKSTPWDILDS